MIDVGHIEDMVCLAVNEVLSCGYPVDRASLYRGRTRVSLHVSMARQFAYLVLHDMFNLSYSSIARRSGFAVRNVVGGVAKARHLLFVDDTYHEVYMSIRRLLKC